MKILLIEDSPDDAFLIQRNSPGNEFTHCTDLKSALVIMDSQLPDIDLIVLDLGLPDSQGEMTLDTIISHNKSNIPIIILSGYITDEIATRAVKSGRQCLEKDTMTPELFEMVVTKAIERR